MSERKLFTSESVSEGHPDKIADQISDAILDAILEQDPEAHVAAETAVYTGSVHVFGEISTNAYVDINRVVRDTIAEIGYTNTEYGFLRRRSEFTHLWWSNLQILLKGLMKP